jgi:Domain of unknown function (DUF4145)
MSTEKQQFYRANCPTCRREQNCDLVGQVKKPWTYFDGRGNRADGGVNHSLVECRGCNTVFNESSSWNDQDFDHGYDENGNIIIELNYNKETFPKTPSRPIPDWFEILERIDFHLWKIMTESYKSLDVNCIILSVIGLRTALDRAMEKLGIDAGLPFAAKLAQLKEGGWIGETEHGLLDVLTNAGHAAAHRGWAPDRDQAYHLFDVLENFTQRTFVNGKRALDIQEAIPGRQRPRAKSSDQ